MLSGHASHGAQAGLILTFWLKMTLVSWFFTSYILGLQISVTTPSNSSLILLLKLYFWEGLGERAWLVCVHKELTIVSEWDLSESSSLRAGSSGNLETPWGISLPSLYPCLLWMLLLLLQFCLLKKPWSCYQTYHRCCRLLLFFRNRCMRLLYILS